MEQLEFQDFSGGVTDYPLNAPPNKVRVCDNLLLNQYQGQAKPFTRPGSYFYDEDYRQAVANRISTCYLYRSKFYIQAAQELYYYTTSGWSEITGPSSKNAFTAATASSVFTYSHWNNHTLIAHSGYQYPRKVWVDNTNTPKIHEAGLPTPSIVGMSHTSAASTADYIYVIVYRFEYVTSDNITFIDRSAPSLPYLATSVTAASVTLNNIPALANGTDDIFQLTSIVKEIYRTTDDGSVLYYAGEIPNATTSFADSVSDATLVDKVDNELLYTEDGRAANDRPPRCKLVHIFGDIAYYANLKIYNSDTSLDEVFTYRVQQSIPGDIDASPGDFYVDVDDEIVGMGSTKSNLVLLCRNSVYRVDGQIDELGRGEMIAERISDTANCVSAQSVVQTLDGVFWAGDDGIYFTDGFQVIKLNGDYDKTYREFVSEGGDPNQTKQNRIQGKYDKKRNRIWWTVQHLTNSVSGDVDKCYILDLNFGIKPEASFQTATGVSSFTPSAIEFDSGNLIRCHKDGYVFKHSDSLFSDIKVDGAVLTATPTYQTIFYTLETVSTNFGTSFTRKYVPSMNMTAESSTNLSLQITSNNDDQKSLVDLSPVRYRGSILWGDPDIYWSDSSLIWGQQGLISEKRRFPAKNMRCLYKGLKFTNAKVVIISSDGLSVATVNASAKTVTLPGSFEWPTYAVDYMIAFEADGFVNEFTITARTVSTLTYSDATNITASAASARWVIRGYPKNEVLNLINYSIHYNMFGPTQDVFNKTDTGEPS